MPLFESVCGNIDCPAVGYPQEHYYKNLSEPMNRCDCCGGPTEKIQSAFKVVFTGPITARYLDKSIEGGNAPDGGHWFFERDKVTGKTKPTWVEDFQTQKELCKRNGVANPREMPRNWHVSEDGTTTVNSRGMPGTEL